MNNKYDDIINLPHYEPKKHKRMSIEARSAQFAPFSALTGYDDVVKETGRLTQKEMYLSEEQKINISNNLQQALENKNEVTITYFIKDEKKTGGKYLNKTCIIKKYDSIKQIIIFEDKIQIQIYDVIDIQEKEFII
jgi:hypothetical protein